LARKTILTILHIKSVVHAESQSMPRSISPALSFALFVGLACFAVAAFAPKLLNDGDTYWHIRAGEWMLTHHAVLRRDIFSYTMGGAPWHTQEWLAEILMALVWVAGGWPGIHLLFAVSTGMTAVIVAMFVRTRLEMTSALLTVVLGLCCISGSLLARPHLLTLPLLAIWTCGLVASRERNKAPPFWLIVVMPIWANLHGSFAFGLALGGALGIEAVVEAKQRKTAALDWGVFLLAATLLAMATPFGFQTLLFPFHLAAMHSLAYVKEWQAVDFSQFSPLLVALFTGLFVLGSGKVKIPTMRLLLVLGLIWLALAHSRHQMLLGVIAPVLLSPALAKTWPAKTQANQPQLAVLAALILVALIGVRLMVPVVIADGPRSPVSAMAHLPSPVRDTRVLNDDSFSGYLIWAGVKVFIDSRVDFYGDAFVQNYADIVSPDRDKLAANLARYDVRWTIFSQNTPMVKLMDHMPGWRRLYSDRLAVVHVRAAVQP
jgi:hypothetical protein